MLFTGLYVYVLSTRSKKRSSKQHAIVSRHPDISFPSLSNNIAKNWIFFLLFLSAFIMYSIDWEQIQNRTQYGTALISCTLNSLLIFLILMKSPKKLGAYKYLMICVSSFQIFYSIMDVAVSPVFHSHGVSCIIFIDLRKKNFTRDTALILETIYCACFGSSMAVFGINFFYRYLVASGSELLAKFNNLKVLTWLIIPLIYGLVWGFTAYFFCNPSEAVNEYIRHNILETFDIKVEDLTYIGVFLYSLPDANGQLHVSDRAKLAFAMVFVEMTTSFFAILYFATKCFLRINSLFKSYTFSAQHVGLQSQLFYALLSQTLIPVLLMHLPGSAMFIFIVLDWELGMACGIVSITIALYPAIDPLPTLLIVRSYRKGLYEYFSRARQFILPCPS